MVALAGQSVHVLVRNYLSNTFNSLLVFAACKQK